MLMGIRTYLCPGILGISHNFYWNAKPVMALAIGSIFSTLQVVPLILLTLEAWRLRQMPDAAVREANRAQGTRALFGMLSRWHALKPAEAALDQAILITPLRIKEVASD